MATGLSTCLMSETLSEVIGNPKMSIKRKDKIKCLRWMIQ